jgi:ribosome modulation factor
MTAAKTADKSAQAAYVKDGLRGRSRECVWVVIEGIATKDKDNSEEQGTGTRDQGLGGSRGVAVAENVALQGDLICRL